MSKSKQYSFQMIGAIGIPFTKQHKPFSKATTTREVNAYIIAPKLIFMKSLITILPVLAGCSSGMHLLRVPGFETQKIMVNSGNTDVQNHQPVFDRSKL